MTRDEVIAVLRRENPAAPNGDVVMYADCFMDYTEAQENIAKNGNIVAHPRTGTPIENPYIKVKATAMTHLRKITKIRRTGDIWR